MSKLHPSLQRFVDKHQTGTAKHKRAAHDQLRPILATTAAVQAHVVELQQELTAAELEAHDHALDGTLNFMHIRLKGAAEKAAEFARVGRELAQILVEVENGLAQDIAGAHRILRGPNVEPSAADAQPESAS